MCTKALINYLMKKCDRATHRNTLDIQLEQYNGDVMGATICEILDEGTLRECSKKRYQLVEDGDRKSP